MALPITSTKISYSMKLEIVQVIKMGEKRSILLKNTVNKSTIKAVYNNKDKIHQIVTDNFCIVFLMLH